jgi:hypothetical protein
MSRNYYSEIHLHIVWHTKSSLPLLTPHVEPFVHRYLKQRLVNTPGVFVHEVGGTETHVHVVVSIVPTILICMRVDRAVEGLVLARGEPSISRPQGVGMAGRIRRGQFRDKGPGMGQCVRS